MVVTKRIAAILGSVALASTLAACGGGPQEVDADEVDPTQGSEAGEGKIVIAETNADNIQGICKRAFGEVEDVLTTIKPELPEGTEYGQTEDRYQEGGGWADEYFPDDDGLSNEGSTNGTIRCQGPAFYEDSEGEETSLQFSISITGGDEAPRGNTDYTVAKDGMTAGIKSYTKTGPTGSMEYKVIDQTIGEKFLTDDVLTQFSP